MSCLGLFITLSCTYTYTFRMTTCYPILNLSPLSLTASCWIYSYSHAWLGTGLVPFTQP